MFQRILFNECPPKGCGGRGDTGYSVSIWVVGTDGSGLHSSCPVGACGAIPITAPTARES